MYDVSAFFRKWDCMLSERILVLGASGFLGSVVLAKLQEQSVEMVIGTAFNNCLGADLTFLNVYDDESVKLLFQNLQPQIIVWCLMDMAQEDELTAVGLKNILENASHASHIIYISTDAFKGGTGDYSEETPMTYLDKSHVGAVYVNGKLNGEKMVLDRGNSTVVRTGPIYGQNVVGKWDKRTSRLIEASLRHEVLVFSDNLYKTFVHVEDLADLIVEIIDQSYMGLIHAGPDEKESYFSFHLKMSRRLELDQTLISASNLSKNEALEKGLTLDTSMNTQKCRTLFKTRFRSV